MFRCEAAGSLRPAFGFGTSDGWRPFRPFREILRCVHRFLRPPVTSQPACVAPLSVTLVPIVAGAAVGTTPAGAAISGHDDTVYAFGTASFHGSTPGKHLNAPIVGMAPTPNGKGYWLVANDGGVFGFNAPFFGSLGAMHLNSPIVGMAATPTGKGYWLVAGDGGVFTFGDAKFYGSTGAMHLNSPITQMIPGPGGKGYWLMATDGGVFTFGSAKFHGSTGAKRLNAPIVGMTATPERRRLPPRRERRRRVHVRQRALPRLDRQQARPSPVVGIAGTSTGGGYWLATRNGSVYNFGDAKNQGGAKKLLSPIRQITQITSVPGNGGYRLLALPAPLMIAPPLGVGSTGAAVVGGADPAPRARLLAARRQRRLRLPHPAGRVRVPEVQPACRARGRSTS